MADKQNNRIQCKKANVYMFEGTHKVNKCNLQYMYSKQSAFIVCFDWTCMQKREVKNKA